MKKNYFYSSTLLLLLISQFARSQNYSLSLNGSNYIDCGTATSTALNATSIRTMECWVKFNNFTGNQEILSRSTNSKGIELLLYAGNLAFFCMNGSTAASHIDYPASNLSTGVWYHVAAAWDGTKEGMRLYVNGVSVGTRFDIGNINVTGITNPVSTFRIGQWSEATENRFLNGSVDEVKVWSVNRSAADIKKYMFTPVAGNATGLIAYYPMNEGSGLSAVNATLNTVLNGMAVSVPGWSSSPIQFASNALNFDGVNDQVVVPASPLFEIATGTVECWLHPTALSTTNQACFIGNRGAAGARYSFHIAANQIGLFTSATGYTTLPYTFTNGLWYHIAFVCTNSNTQVYINGSLAGTIAAKPGTATGLPLIIGIAKNGSGADMEPYAGDIDEVRIWNTQRTPAEIASYMYISLNGTEPGLTGLNTNFNFNQGIPSGANTGLSVAVEGTANNNHGILTNFSLTGGTSNYNITTSVILPVQLTAFNAIRNGRNAELHWSTAQEQNSHSFIVERSADGRQFSTIGTVAAAGTSTTTTNYSFTDVSAKAGINYYRLQQVSTDGKTIASKTVSVLFPGAESIAIAPNPASNTLHYTISSLQNAQATVSIITIAGQELWTSATTLRAGTNTLHTDIHYLPAGQYMLRVVNKESGVRSSQQFTIVK